MKSWLLGLLIILSVATAMFTFQQKIKTPVTEEDYIMDGLVGANKMLLNASAIGYYAKISFPQNVLLARYILQPVFVDDTREMDTTIFIFPVDASNLTIDSALANRHIIWKNKNDRYRYFLAANKQN